MLKGIELLFSQIKLLLFSIDGNNHIAPVPAPLPGKKTHLLIHNAVRFLLQDVFSMNRFNLLMGHGLKPVRVTVQGKVTANLAGSILQIQIQGNLLQIPETYRVSSSRKKPFTSSTSFPLWVWV